MKVEESEEMWIGEREGRRRRGERERDRGLRLRCEGRLIAIMCEDMKIYGNVEMENERRG